MGKKKKKSQKSISILKEAEKVIDTTYENIRKEIEEIQLQLNIADEKARKKAKKEAKKNKKDVNNYYDTSEIRCQARQSIIEQFEGNTLLDRIIMVLNDIAPIVITIARLIAELIACILNVDFIKTKVKPEILEKMNMIRKRALSMI